MTGLSCSNGDGEKRDPLSPHCCAHTHAHGVEHAPRADQTEAKHRGKHALAEKSVLLQKSVHTGTGHSVILNCLQRQSSSIHQERRSHAESSQSWKSDSRVLTLFSFIDPWMFDV